MNQFATIKPIKLTPSLETLLLAGEQADSADAAEQFLDRLRGGPRPPKPAKKVRIVRVEVTLTGPPVRMPAGIAFMIFREDALALGKLGFPEIPAPAESARDKCFAFLDVSPSLRTHIRRRAKVHKMTPEAYLGFALHRAAGTATLTADDYDGIARQMRGGPTGRAVRS